MFQDIPTQVKLMGWSRNSCCFGSLFLFFFLLEISLYTSKTSCFKSYVTSKTSLYFVHILLIIPQFQEACSKLLSVTSSVHLHAVFLPFARCSSLALVPADNHPTALIWIGLVWRYNLVSPKHILKYNPILNANHSRAMNRKAKDFLICTMLWQCFLYSDFPFPVLTLLERGYMLIELLTYPLHIFSFLLLVSSSLSKFFHSFFRRKNFDISRSFFNINFKNLYFEE